MIPGFFWRAKEGFPLGSSGTKAARGILKIKHKSCSVADSSIDFPLERNYDVDIQQMLAVKLALEECAIGWMGQSNHFRFGLTTRTLSISVRPSIWTLVKLAGPFSSVVSALSCHTVQVPDWSSWLMKASSRFKNLALPIPSYCSSDLECWGKGQDGLFDQPSPKPMSWGFSCYWVFVLSCYKGATLQG